MRSSKYYHSVQALGDQPDRDDTGVTIQLFLKRSFHMQEKEESLCYNSSWVMLAV